MEHVVADNIDLSELEQYLVSDLSPDDCMGLFDLDGFLTGIVVGPELILPSEWLPMIWRNEEPAFESAGEAESIISLIMGRYNEIVTASMPIQRSLSPSSGRDQRAR
jgi:uncharacterized protein